MRPARCAALVALLVLATPSLASHATQHPHTSKTKTTSTGSQTQERPKALKSSHTQWSQTADNEVPYTYHSTRAQNFQPGESQESQTQQPFRQQTAEGNGLPSGTLQQGHTRPVAPMISPAADSTKRERPFVSRAFSEHGRPTPPSHMEIMNLDSQLPEIHIITGIGASPQKNNFPNNDATGGVGNPGLTGIPINLRNSNNYLIPTDKHTSATAKPVFGGVGSDQLQNYPLKLGGSFKAPSEQEFVSVGHYQNQPSLPLTSAPPIDTRIGFVPAQQRSPQEFQNIQSPSDDISVKQLLSLLQSSADDILQPQPPTSSFFSPLSTLPPLPPSSLFLSSFTTQTPAPTQQPDHSPLQALQQYYQQQYLQNQRPADQEGPIFLFDDPPLVSTDTAGQPSPLHFLNDEPYFPANNPSLLPEDLDAFDSLLELSQVEQEDNTPVAAVLTSGSLTSGGGCLSSTSCTFLVALAVAVGVSSAVAVSFSTGFLGRRKRDVESLNCLPNNIFMLLEHYLQFIEKKPLNITQEEKQVFTVLSNLTDDAAWMVLLKLESMLFKENLRNLTKYQSNKDVIIPQYLLNYLQRTCSENVKSEEPVPHTKKDQDTSQLNGELTLTDPSLYRTMNQLHMINYNTPSILSWARKEWKESSSKQILSNSGDGRAADILRGPSVEHTAQSSPSLSGSSALPSIPHTTGSSQPTVLHSGSFRILHTHTKGSAQDQKEILLDVNRNLQGPHQILQQHYVAPDQKVSVPHAGHGHDFSSHVPNSDHPQHRPRVNKKKLQEILQFSQVVCRALVAPDTPNKTPKGHSEYERKEKEKFFTRPSDTEWSPGLTARHFLLPSTVKNPSGHSNIIRFIAEMCNTLARAGLLWN